MTRVCLNGILPLILNYLNITVMVKKINLQECERRMVATGISAQQKEKYRGILRRLSAALEKPGAVNLMLADRLKYVIFSASETGICLSQNDFWNAALKGYTFMCFNVPLKLKDNIFSVDRVYGNPYKENVKKIGSLVVYQPASSDSDPFLDIRTVALQVPPYLTERVDSFCLCLKEDDYAVHSYNYVLGAYEFEVILFGE